MKKTFVLIAMLVTFSFYSTAQVNPNAIGLRLGGGSFNGAEISYQLGVSEANRFEFDLGFGSSEHHSRTYVTGIYHWTWNIVEGFNWYVGPGAAIGVFNDNDEDAYINVSVGGQIGLEYDFNSLGAPILLSLDARPMWDLLGSNAGIGWGTALGIRYIW